MPDMVVYRTISLASFTALRVVTNSLGVTPLSRYLCPTDRCLFFSRVFFPLLPQHWMQSCLFSGSSMGVARSIISIFFLFVRRISQYGVGIWDSSKSVPVSVQHLLFSCTSCAGWRVIPFGSGLCFAVFVLSTFFCARVMRWASGNAAVSMSDLSVGTKLCAYLDAHELHTVECDHISQLAVSACPTRKR